MATFVYAPAIRVHIESQDKGIIDVSGDIANWELIRRSNAVSSFNFLLQNAQRKYDGVFRPSDRISVELKRITWVRVFTGSLNNSPIFSAWPRALPMSASCSLKKLQFWPWDPTTTAAVDMFQEFLGSPSLTNSAAGDGGLSNLATMALQRVTNWDPTTSPTGKPKNVHFGRVPNTWFKWAEKTETLITQASNMQAILGSQATIHGNQVVGQIAFPAGNYNGVRLTDVQAGNVASIYAVILGQGDISTAALQDRALLIAIMTAMQESTLQVLDHGDRDSVGLYQQRPSQGWGTKAECMDIVHSTKAFISHLLKVPNWNTIDPGMAAQSVQRSAFPDAYNTWLNMATKIVSVARSIYQKQLTSGGNNTVASGGLAAGQPSGTMPRKGTGSSMASVALDLIKSRPAGSIRYSQDNVSAPESSAPTVLDCSALVQWVYYHTTGSLLNHRRSEDQYALCKTSGGAIIPVELAAKIQGALVFVVNPANDDAHHVGVSLGNNTHVAAHTDGIPLAQQVTAGDPVIGEFTTGGLLPGIDYSKAATDAATATKLQQILKTTTSVSSVAIGPGADPSITTGGSSTTTGTSVIDQLISIVANPPVASGDVYGGPRQLIHNQTFLPWLQTVTNSSMRAFCSAPNGDFIAWFPDYFGIWGTAASMNIQPIELQDFTVDWSDQQIVTHEFVVGSLPSVIDNVSGGVMNGADSTYQGLTQLQATRGIATMDFPQIFQAIYGKVPGKNFVSSYLQRFGARPNLDQMANIRAGDQEFYMALWNFMYYWAAQFSAVVPMTFMPELYPGMLLKIPAFDFQAYVTEVTHSGSYGQNGGFTTKATIVAPARLDKTARSDLFGMLPLGGR
jgi:cell wall-associated NlpC family hydrolase